MPYKDIEKRRACTRNWLKNHPEKARAATDRWQKEHPDLVAAANRRSHAAKRQAVLDAYGWECICCGATEKLTIDHIVPSSADSPEPRHGGRLYYWLVKNNFPDGFQTLCAMCNKSKWRSERCRLNHNLVAKGAA